MVGDQRRGHEGEIVWGNRTTDSSLASRLQCQQARLIPVTRCCGRRRVGRPHHCRSDGARARNTRPSRAYADGGPVPGTAGRARSAGVGCGGRIRDPPMPSAAETPGGAPWSIYRLNDSGTNAKLGLKNGPLRSTRRLRREAAVFPAKDLARPLRGCRWQRGRPERDSGGSVIAMGLIFGNSAATGSMGSAPPSVGDTGAWPTNEQRQSVTVTCGTLPTARINP